MKGWTYFVSAFRKYGVFNGRACRSEYWFYQLFLTIFLSLCVALDIFIFDGPVYEIYYTGGLIPIFVFIGLFFIVFFLPSLAVTVRRYHDVDFTDWAYIIPILNIIVPFLGGSYGKNYYGEDPLGRGPNEWKLSGSYIVLEGTKLFQENWYNYDTVEKVLQKGEKVFHIRKGKKEYVNGIQGKMVKVITMDGITGWCFSGFLEKDST